MSTDDDQIAGRIAPVTRTPPEPASPVAGFIVPAQRPDVDPPLFKVVRTGMGRWDADVPEPTCAHRYYTLDEEWNRVLCRECGTALDAFAVLRKFAEWEQTWRSRQAHAEAAERRFYLLECRRLVALRTLPDAARAEGERLLRDEYRRTLGELRDLAGTLEAARRGAVRDAKRG